MKKFFEKGYGGRLYVQLYKDKIIARLVETAEEVVHQVKKNFHHERMPIGNFKIASDELSKALKPLLGSGLSKRRPVIIMHQRELVTGGLSQIEVQLLEELAYSENARKTIVWQGKELSNTDRTL